MPEPWSWNDAIRLDGERTVPPENYAHGEMPLSEARKRGHRTTRRKMQQETPPAYLKERGRKGGLETQRRRRSLASSPNKEYTGGDVERITNDGHGSSAAPHPPAGEGVGQNPSDHP